MKVVALPHLQTASVEVTEWQVEVHGERHQLPQVLKRWDYQTPLRFECAVRIALSSVLSDCGLAADATLALIATWWASSTNVRRTGTLVELNGSSDYLLAFDVPPGVVGGTLTLNRQLVLVDPGGTEDELAARRSGAILWAEARETRGVAVLEGDAARFPTEVIDFQSARVAAPDGAWWLDADLSDLDVTPFAAMRLYINENHSLMKQVLSGDAGPLTSAVAEILEWDVARSLMDAALSSQDFIDGWGGFRPGSLGDVLELLLRKYWPGEDSRSLDALKRQDSGIFEARLQARMRLLAGAS